jgi:hypothetical protein
VSWPQTSILRARCSRYSRRLLGADGDPFIRLFVQRITGKFADSEEFVSIYTN